MHTPKMQEAVDACVKAGVGLVSMKSQAGRPGKHEIGGRAKLGMVDRFLKRGFTDKQAKLKIIWENPNIPASAPRCPT